MTQHASIQCRLVRGIDADCDSGCYFDNNFYYNFCSCSEQVVVCGSRSRKWISSQNITEVHLHEILIASFGFTLSKRSKLQPKQMPYIFRNCKHLSILSQTLGSVCSPSFITVSPIHKGYHVRPPTFKSSPVQPASSCPF